MKKTFEQEVSEILNPVIENFKKFPPVRQQKALAQVDKIVAEQADEFTKDIALRLRNYFAELAK